MSERPTIDGVVPIVSMEEVRENMLGATLDTSIGAGCHYYRFRTGDGVTIEDGDESIEGVIKSVQIEHGVTLFIQTGVVRDE